MSTEFVIITLLLIIECTLIGALWLVFGKIDELKTYIYKEEVLLRTDMVDMFGRGSELDKDRNDIFNKQNEVFNGIYEQYKAILKAYELHSKEGKDLISEYRDLRLNIRKAEMHYSDCYEEFRRCDEQFKELKALLEKEHPDVTIKVEPVETVETNAGPIEVKREDVTFDIPSEEVKPKPKRTSRKKKSDLDLAERKEAEETT